MVLWLCCLIIAEKNVPIQNGSYIRQVNVIRDIYFHISLIYFQMVHLYPIDVLKHLNVSSSFKALV